MERSKTIIGYALVFLFSTSLSLGLVFQVADLTGTDWEGGAAGVFFIGIVLLVAGIILWKLHLLGLNSLVIIEIAAISAMLTSLLVTLVAVFLAPQ
jgi:hypothetical protein